jgi:Ser/Thr protein kinase RdoA (MazF antagonist)
MAIFPTQYSTLSAAALGDHIANAYGFSGLSCRLLVRNVSDTYLLRDSHDKYIFKIYRDAHRKLNEIEGEVELLQRLKENNVPVAAPILDKTGNAIQQFHAAEGVRNGVLFEYAKGKVHIQPNHQQLAIIGRELAAMHNVTANLTLSYPRPTYDYYTTLERPLALIAPRFAEFQLPDEYAFLKGLAADTISAFDGLEPATFPYGYCHYDFLPKNFHFDEADRLTFFDFDWAGRGHLANDLMIFCMQYFFLVHHQLITREAADRDLDVFLQAYHRHRPILPVELKAIPHLGAMFWLYGLGFYEDNFDDFSNTFLGPRFTRERVQMIRQWSELPPPAMF